MVRCSECASEGKHFHRLTYEELRSVFLPGRSHETVERVWRKALELARELQRISWFKSRLDYEPRVLRLSDLTGVPRDRRVPCWFELCGERFDQFGAIPEQEGYDSDIVCAGRRYTPAEWHPILLKVLIDGESTFFFSDELMHPEMGYPTEVSKAIGALETAKTDAAKVLALDRFISAAHGDGPLANMVVVGGEKTLDRLKED